MREIRLENRTQAERVNSRGLESYREKSQCSGIGSAELMQQTGITYRQLDYWCRVGYIEPHTHNGREAAQPGTGYRRCFALAEAAKILAFKQLVDDCGIEHERAWLMIKHPGRLLDWADYLADLHDQLLHPHLVDNPVEAA